MESYIPISKINDFIFCPYSLIYHSIYEGFTEKTYHDVPQTAGKISHAKIDKGEYSSAKKFLQGIDVYSEKYGLCGKIDIFDQENGILIERKNKIERIYDGYKYQLYAQYFSLNEMGYNVKKIVLHALTTNKRFNLPLPRGEELKKFESTIAAINDFNPLRDKVDINPQKCAHCIYYVLCAYAVSQ
ncbi:TPA: type V CRISPR-associated protein Cas4 [Candidatus Falkowbacteria bacterium]|nr:type V CRISPR-associated protein Cas4 [Candidatus Falkowbacteria bacterium]